MMETILGSTHQKFRHCLIWLCWHITTTTSAPKKEKFCTFSFFFNAAQSCEWSPGSVMHCLFSGNVLFLLTGPCCLPEAVLSHCLWSLWKLHKDGVSFHTVFRGCGKAFSETAWRLKAFRRFWRPHESTPHYCTISVASKNCTKTHFFLALLFRGYQGHVIAWLSCRTSRGCTRIHPILAQCNKKSCKNRAAFKNKGLSGVGECWGVTRNIMVCHLWHICHRFAITALDYEKLLCHWVVFSMLCRQ